MRIFYVAVLFLISFVLLFTAVGCGTQSAENKPTKTEDEYVREAVESKASSYHLFIKIGGKDLKYTRVSITTVRELSDKSSYGSVASATKKTYQVNGKIYITDVYDDTYENSFNCTVTGSGDKWTSSQIETISDNWRIQR